MGYPVKSHSSTIENHLADRLRNQVKKMGFELKKPKKAKAKPAKKAVAKPAVAKAAVKTPPKPAAPAKAKVAPIKAKPPAEKKKPVETKPPDKPVEKAPQVKPAPAVAEKPQPKKEVKRIDKKVVEENLRQRELKKQKEQEDFERRERNRNRQKIKRKEEEERKRKKRRDEDTRRKKAAEEREIQRLIDAEDRKRFEEESKRIVIDEATTIKEFAEKLRVGVNEIIKRLIGKGIMATMNQTIDVEVARELALEMNYELVTREDEELEEKTEEVEDKSKLNLRPPVVTIMGHVDHGKTSLLDMIRKTRVTEEEAGGITQRIGAYRINVRGGSVVFLDTPGHEAFTSMRSRGAAVTDIVVLVVAADDGVMPQTVEAIHHAKAAGVPVLVAINKIDKPGANLDRIKQQLATHELVPEDWGGTTIFAEVSAKENIGIEELLELILLQAEMLELKTNWDRMAYGTIIESKLDKGRGAVATVLVQKGTLKVGDPFTAGMHYGKVRALLDDKGEKIQKVGPSTPVEILGFSGVPDAGETFMVVESERKAHQISINRQNTGRVENLTAKGHVKLEDLHVQITKGKIKDLNMIIKADVQGSIEAVNKALGDINIDKTQIRVLHGAVGGITETDISLAAASNAIVIGFNVRPTEKARHMAEDEEVDVRLYSVIYNAIDDIKAALEGMLEPEFEEKVEGRAEVRNTFHISKVGTIAGCMVTSGKITRNLDARLIRDDMVIFTGKVNSLKRFKDDAKEVQSGYECGIGFDQYSDIKVADVIETFTVEEVKPLNQVATQKA